MHTCYQLTSGNSNIRRLTLVALLLCIASHFLQHSLLADDHHSAHEKITRYAKSIESLNEKYRAHVEVREAIATEFNEIYFQFAEAGQQGEAINRQAHLEFQAWLQAYTQRLVSQSLLMRTSASPNPHIIDRLESGPINTRGIETALALSTEQNQGVRVSQLQLAQNLNAQRRQKLIQELSRLDERTKAWAAEDIQLARNYVSQSDITNIRSRLELKSARRLLEGERESNRDNVGAQLSLAVTLMRLEEYDAAHAQLKSLIAQGGLPAVIAKAIRAELYMLTNQEHEAKRDLATARTLKTPETLLLQARVYTKLGDSKTTETLWTTLTKTTEYEVVAHCNLALSQIARRPNEAEIKRAISESQLAVDLSGGDDWHCQLTSALCLAAGGQKEAALAACEKAAEYAIGNKKTLCIEIGDKIKQGESVAWQY